MKNNTTIRKNYTLNGACRQLVLPFNLEFFIPENDSVRLLSQILEELNYTKLYRAYSCKGRKSAVSPIVLFKVIVYAYMNNIYSTRKIEEACTRDVNFMWLLEGQVAPDHNTIARFRTERLADGVLDDLFEQFVLKLFELGEIQFKTIFIDGTKIESKANKYTFVWKKVVLKNESKMYDSIQKFIASINPEYRIKAKVRKNHVAKDLQKILRQVGNICQKEKIVFVHGAGRQKTEIQRIFETIEEFYQRQLNYDRSKETFGDRNSYSKTDEDATFMHMKEDHMRNSQLKPGYNVQIGVESEYVIHTDIFSNRNDVGTLIPFLNGLKKHYRHHIKRVVADSGYESEQNYVFLKKNKYVAFIKPSTYDYQKKKSFKKNIGRYENMQYDSVNDCYICHNGQTLTLKGIHKSHNRQTRYTSELSVYQSKDCSNCTFKNECTKAEGNKTIKVSKKLKEERNNSLQNIISPEGINLRVNRSIQVEGAFGVLKNDYSFKRFLTKGKTNVSLEFKLLCFGYNMNKLHNKIQSGRTGTHLHKCEETA